MRARPLALSACTGLLLQATTPSLAQNTVSNPLDICALPVSRLVFTLADLSTYNCNGDASKCTSLCWCRAWASTPATASTLALCVSANAASTCSGDSFDCRAALASQNITTNSTAATNSSGQALHTIESNDNTDKGENKGGISTTVSVVIVLLCVAVLGGLAFAANWYRHRPKSISGPATVSGGVQIGPQLTLTEIDDYDEKLPASTRTSHRRSHESQGPMQFDPNASVISGVSGTSYHDLDNTKLGHMNEDLAITDTELSLSKDGKRRVFSPASREDSRDDLASSSFLSDDSMDVAPLGRGQQPPYLHDESSTFISVASTSYLTRYNESFSSQITLPESEADSLADSMIDSSRSRKEVEF